MACQTQKTNMIEQNASATDVSIDIEPDHIEVKVEEPLRVKFIYNGPRPPAKMEKSIFHVNNDFCRVDLNMKNKDNWKTIDSWVSRLRSILDRRGVFRCEDIDMFRWNSETFASYPKFVSGSTYVSDGNLQMFLDGLQEIENTVSSFRV